MSASVTGRRYAVRARLAAIRLAHPPSFASNSGELRRGLAVALAEAGPPSLDLDPAELRRDSGEQMKIFRRLSVSDTPGELNGPSTLTPPTRRGSRSPRLNSSPARNPWGPPTNSSDSTWARSTNVTATSYVPAFTGTGMFANRLM